MHGTNVKKKNLITVSWIVRPSF